MQLKKIFHFIGIYFLSIHLSLGMQSDIQVKVLKNIDSIRDPALETIVSELNEESLKNLKSKKTCYNDQSEKFQQTNCAKFALITKDIHDNFSVEKYSHIYASGFGIEEHDPDIIHTGTHFIPHGNNEKLTKVMENAVVRLKFIEAFNELVESDIQLPKDAEEKQIVARGSPHFHSETAFFMDMNLDTEKKDKFLKKIKNAEQAFLYTYSTNPICANCNTKFKHQLKLHPEEKKLDFIYVHGRSTDEFKATNLANAPEGQINSDSSKKAGHVLFGLHDGHEEHEDKKRKKAHTEVEDKDKDKDKEQYEDTRPTKKVKKNEG